MVAVGFGNLPVAFNKPVAIFVSSGAKMCDNATVWTGMINDTCFEQAWRESASSLSNYL